MCIRDRHDTDALSSPHRSLGDISIRWSMFNSTHKHHSGYYNFIFLFTWSQKGLYTKHGKRVIKNYKITSVVRNTLFNITTVVLSFWSALSFLYSKPNTSPYRTNSKYNCLLYTSIFPLNRLIVKQIPLPNYMRWSLRS